MTNLEKKAVRLASAFFFISGAAALIYEVVWVKLLGLVFGNTTFAVSTVLSAYMAGLGFGSYFLGRLSDRWERPVCAYGMLEIGIGAYAGLTPLLLLFIQGSYIYLVKALDPGFAGFTALRLCLSFLVVFIPTFFMGGTLPVLSKFFTKQSGNAGTQVAFLYGLNTIGAVAGTALAGFWLLPVLGVQKTLLMAVIFNVGIGCLALLLSSQVETLKKSKAAEARGKTRSATSPQEMWLVTVLFLSGITAMLYEVTWTRTLATVLGSSTYAFTLMLVTFLLGLGTGSVSWKGFLKKHEAKQVYLGYLLASISFFSLLSLPLFPSVGLVIVRLHALTLGRYGALQFSFFLICAFLMFVPAFFFGGLFPVATALYTQHSKNIGQKIGRLYLANTLGNILGSLAAGFLLIPLIGIHNTICLAAGIGALLALVSLKKTFFCLLGALLIVWSGFQANSGWDKPLLTSGINLRPNTLLTEKNADILSMVHNIEVLFYKEGLNSIVSVGQYGDDRHIKVNGKTDASTREDMSTQLLLGHLPHILHPNPKQSLIIGYGSGTTLAAALAYPIDHADCLEIEPAVLQAAPFFDDVNRKTYNDPRASLIVNDGRNHLLTHDKTYDVIISEPSNPWMAGVANLFSLEFYRLVDKRLNPDGIFCQWLQSYGIAPEDFQMVVATVRTVFPHVTVWNASKGDYLLLATKKPQVFDYKLVERALKLPLVQKDLSSFEIETPAGLLGHFVLGDKDSKRFAANALINSDDQLFLEFNTPKTLYEATSPLIASLLASLRTEFLPPVSGLATPVETQPELLADIGKSLLALQKPELAKKVFERALSLDAKNPAALGGMGRCLALEKKWFDAISYFQKSGTAESFAYLGWTLHLAGDNKAALEALEKATSLPDVKWEYFVWKARVLEAVQQWPAALDSYEKSLTMKFDIMVELSVARMEAKTGNTGPALARIAKLRERFVTFYPLYGELGDICIAAHRPDIAVAAYEHFLTINPYSTNAWLNLAKLYALMRNPEKSFEASRKAAALDPFATL